MDVGGKSSGESFLCELNRFGRLEVRLHSGKLTGTNIAGYRSPTKMCCHLGVFCQHPGKITLTKKTYLNPPRVWNLSPLTTKNRPGGWNLTPSEGLGAYILYQSELYIKTRQPFVTILESNWPLSWKVNPPKQGFFQSKPGSIGVKLHGLIRSTQTCRRLFFFLGLASLNFFRTTSKVR